MKLGSWSSLPEGSMRCQRPKEILRRSFDDAPDGVDSELRIVPIDAVQEGDTQVLAAGYPDGWCREPIVPLDSLRRFPSVDSVVSSTMVSAMSPIPTIRQLILLHDAPVPDAMTLRNLCRLESLYAGTAKSDGKLVLDSLPIDSLQQLAVSRWCVDELSSLASLQNLRDLRISSCRTGDSVRALGMLSELRRLDVCGVWRGALNGWKALRNCTRIEESTLHGFCAVDLRPLATWRGLRRLTISGKLRSLAGIEVLDALEQFVLVNERPLDSISALTAVPSLRLLTLVLTDSPELGDLSRLFNLKELKLEARPAARIGSLKGLRQCRALQAIELSQVLVDDANLSPLAELPRLERVKIHNDDGSLRHSAVELQRVRPDIHVSYHAVGEADLSFLANVRTLRQLTIKSGDESQTSAASEVQRLRPDVHVVHVEDAKGIGFATLKMSDSRATPLKGYFTGNAPAAQRIAVGPISIIPPTGVSQAWSIFEDIVDLVGGRTNTGAEARVRRALRRDRMLLDRLDFDSESDNFCVFATSEEDIRAVADAINDLASQSNGSRRRRRGDR